MKLLMIKDEVCPICQSRTVHDKQESFHSNGEPREFRTFECGCELNYSPNFQKLLVVTQCPKHPTEKEKKAKRKSAQAKLNEFIQSLDTDDEWKKYKLSQVKY